MFLTGNSTNNDIDKEALQAMVLKKLTKLKDEAVYLVDAETHRDFWQAWHRTIVQLEAKDERERYLAVESQLLNLSRFIEGWIQTAVDSTERMEFFVMSKAYEIGSGDDHKDYFWALQIRHDQLVALIRVLTQLLKHIQRLVTLDPKEVMQDPVILGLIAYSVEDQIYLEAEKVHAEREKMF